MEKEEDKAVRNNTSCTVWCILATYRSMIKGAATINPGSSILVY